MLAAVCVVSAASIATQVWLTESVDLGSAAFFVLYVCMGIGLIRLKKWSWALAICGAVFSAGIHSYSGWQLYRRGFGALSNPEFLRMTILLMVIIYLCEGHVRGVFWASDSRKD